MTNKIKIYGYTRRHSTFYCAQVLVFKTSEIKIKSFVLGIFKPLVFINFMGLNPFKRNGRNKLNIHNYAIRYEYGRNTALYLNIPHKKNHFRKHWKACEATSGYIHIEWKNLNFWNVIESINWIVALRAPPSVSFSFKLRTKEFFFKLNSQNTKHGHV